MDQLDRPGQRDRGHYENRIGLNPTFQRVYMVKLCRCTLNGLLQAVVDWAYSFPHGVGTMPICQELAVNTGEEQEHTVTGIELPRLGSCNCSIAQPGPLIGAPAQ